MADKITTLKTKTKENVYPNVIGDNMKDAFVDSSTIKHHFYDQTHKVGFQIANETNIKIQNSLQKPAGLTKTELVGVGTNGQENIEIGDNLTLANGKLSASGGGGGISVIELTDKNGTIASAQLSKINANPQNFAFKYNGKILLFTSADSTTYQYCNNTTSSSDNNVMTTSTLLKITSSTGAYTIAENVHNVVANSIHPVNGGDLTNIQVGSKVYSIPSGGGGGTQRHGYMVDFRDSCYYIVYTTKDYNFQIGQRTEQITDFKSNDEYKDLRYNGFYPAAGYIETSKPVVKLEILNTGTFRAWIYSTSSNKYTFVELSSTSLKIYITKLF